jgi:hypothetical protein
MSTDYDRTTEDTDVITEDAASPVDGTRYDGTTYNGTGDDTSDDDTASDQTMSDDIMSDRVVNDDTLDDQVPAVPAYQDSLAADRDDETSFAPSVDAPSAEAPATEVPSAAAPVTSTPDEDLLGDTTELMAQWKHAQAEFLDDPHAAITEAANVVAEAAGRLEAALRARRSTWDSDGKPDTETMRQGMLEYRRLFDMLVS